MDVKILYEDKDIIVVVKPAGMPSQGDRSSTLDMVSYLKNYLVTTTKGIPYIGIVHRLDRPVGGVMVYAKNNKAAADLSRQIQNHSISKSYLAVLSDQLNPEDGRLENYILQNKQNNTSVITNKNNKQSKLAVLNYKTLETITIDQKMMSLVDIDLITGRHHQIRVQTSYAGAGIYGDTKYNIKYQNQKEKYPLGLFAYKLTFTHPQTKKQMTFEKIPECAPFNMFKLKDE